MIMSLGCRRGRCADGNSIRLRFSLYFLANAFSDLESLDAGLSFKLVFIQCNFIFSTKNSLMINILKCSTLSELYMKIKTIQLIHMYWIFSIYLLVFYLTRKLA